MGGSCGDADFSGKPISQTTARYAGAKGNEPPIREKIGHPLDSSGIRAVLRRAGSCYSRPVMHRRTPTIIYAVVTAFLDVLGFGLLIPVAPKLMAYVQGLPTEGA